VVRGGRDQALLLLAELAAAEHAEGEDGDAEDRGGAKTELDTEEPFAAPVDVAEVEEEGCLVEGEADARAHRDRQPLLGLIVLGEESGGARSEGEEDPGDEVMDVATTDVDVAEGPAFVANPPGREADKRESADESPEEVEEHGFAARGFRVAADGNADGVSGCGGGRFQKRFRVMGLIRPAGEHAAELADDDGAGGTEGNSGKPDRRPLGANPARPATTEADYFSSLMIVFTAAVVPSLSWISTMKVPSSRSGCSSWI